MARAICSLSRQTLHSRLHLPLGLALVAALAAGCARPPGSSLTTPQPTAVWPALFQRTPWPYTEPLPEPAHTPLDGTYVKTDESPAPHIPCKRCPDWLREGGVWMLSLDRGIYRVYHPATGWRSLGSYRVSGDRVRVFNDPNCTDVAGEYRWALAGDALVFEEVGDPCSIHLRADNLTHQPWLSCQPPNREAAISDHWLKPAGCP